MNAKEKLDLTKLPKHVAVIMDGNGRWAKRRGLPRSAGHSAGAKTLQDTTEYLNKMGVRYLTVYAFSTENWKRPKAEIDALMGLLLEYLKDSERRLSAKNIVIKIIGDKTKLSQEIQKQIIKTEAMTQNNSGLTLLIALNYGSRDEILQGVRKIAQDVKSGKLAVEDIDEQCISDVLYTKGVPDPELIIRPSGEYRLSNYLLWQAAYSEFWFDNICWPDFSRKYLLQAIEDYQKRNRRFGGV
ncbi:MAG: isoprenyl transferase [Hyphomonadaceae bacterium]|nr:isoprenyl transferase [Clostridia bacterium]